MNKICKFLTLIILIVAVLLFGIYQYRTFIQTEIYQENSEHLLATYEQVNRTFTLFTQRNCIASCFSGLQNHAIPFQYSQNLIYTADIHPSQNMRICLPF